MYETCDRTRTGKLRKCESYHQLIFANHTHINLPHKGAGYSRLPSNYLPDRLFGLLLLCRLIRTNPAKRCGQNVRSNPKRVIYRCLLEDQKTIRVGDEYSPEKRVVNKPSKVILRISGSDCAGSKKVICRMMNEPDLHLLRWLGPKLAGSNIRDALHLR